MLFKPLKSVDYIVVHCSASGDADIGVQEIRRDHLARSWLDIGYHYVIRRNGAIEQGRLKEVMGAHAKGFNAKSISVCLVGGFDDGTANFTVDQLSTLRILLSGLTTVYPDGFLLGHRDLDGVSKKCPCFDTRRWFYGEQNDTTDTESITSP